MTRFTLITMLLLLAGAATSWAQREPFEQMQKFGPPYDGDGAPSDRFGLAVDISGDWMIVGVQDDDDVQNDNSLTVADTGAGSAVVFQRDPIDPGQWNRVTKLLPENTGEAFGWDVAIDGDIAVVGARTGRSNASNGGSVYIYERNLGGVNNWGLVKVQAALDTESGDAFGWSVDVQGDTLVVAAESEDEVASAAGAAYVFGRDVGGIDMWGQVTKLLPDATRVAVEVFGYNFGDSVAIADDRIVVGASGDDSAEANAGAVYVFERNLGGSGNWGLNEILDAGSVAQNGAGMGNAVGVDGDWLIAGSLGRDTAYLFQRLTSAWTFSKELPGAFSGENRYGDSVAIDGDLLVIGDSLTGNGQPGSTGRDGLLFAHQRDLGGVNNWGLVKAVNSSTTLRGLEFGKSVALDNGTIVGGAPGDNQEGGNSGISGSGAAFVFARNEGGSDNFGETSKVTLGPSGAGSAFGNSVAVDGFYAVVASVSADEFGSQSGAAFIYRREAGSWAYLTTLQPTDIDANDDFGLMVDLDGPYAVAIADGGFPRRVWVFEQDLGGPDNWGQRAAIDLEGTSTLQSVSIAGDIIAVGDWNLLNPAGDRTGAVEIFQRDAGGTNNWGLVKKVGPADVTVNNRFGWAVDVDGDRLVVGARNDDDVANDAGATYIFERNEGGTDNWGEVTKLLASDGATSDNLGSAVAASGNTIAIGAPNSGMASAGSVYLFEQTSPGNWQEQPRIEDPEPRSFNGFGSFLRLVGNQLAVTNPGYCDPDISIGSGCQIGAAWIYQRDLDATGNWELLKQLRSDDRRLGDRFSGSVNGANNRGSLGFDGITVMVGANQADSMNLDVGAVYVFITDELFRDGFESATP